MRTAAVVLSTIFIATAAMAAKVSPLRGAKQLIVVVSPDWDSTGATLRRYERGKAGWVETGEPVEVVIGRSGLAWGKGTNRDTGPGPEKREGDGKSPAGVFRIGPAFGFEAAPSWIQLPYIELDATTECVDDTASQLYNMVVKRPPSTVPDWSSSEKMRSIEVYRWGAVIIHNDPPQKGAGSCIFFHIVDPRGKPTSGCTSMPAGDLETLLRWIDPDAGPLLVQLPRAEYDRLRKLWQLP